MVSFNEIHNASFFTNSGGYSENTALLCKDAGEIFLRLEISDIDESDDNCFESDQYVAIPHGNILRFVNNFIFEFVQRCIPDDFSHVQLMFRRTGVYRNFKFFLNSRGLLEKWHEFENRRTEEALWEWCEENENELSDLKKNTA